MGACAKVFLLALVLLTSLFVRMTIQWKGRVGALQDGAVPVWRNADLPVLNRVLDYLLPVVFDLAELARCPDDGKSAESIACVEAMRVKETESRKAFRAAANYAAEWVTTGDARAVPMVLLRPRKAHFFPDAANAAAAEEAAPPTHAVLWHHGGGLNIGGAEDPYVLTVFDEIVKKLGPASTVLLASVDYALAPEHKFPAAADDSLAAYLWLVALAGPGAHVSLAGASAGAYLSLVTAYRARAAGTARVDSLYLDSPYLKDGFCGGARPPAGEGSFARNGWARLPAVVWLEWGWAAYLGGRPMDDYAMGACDAANWAALDGLPPPAVVVTGRGDPLHDAALEFAATYERGGGAVTLVEATGGHCLFSAFDRAKADEAFSSYAALLLGAATNGTTTCAGS